MFFAALWMREAVGIGRSAGVPPIVGTLQVSRAQKDGDINGELLLAKRGATTAVVIGNQRSCTLKLLDELPITIEAHKVTHIRVSLQPTSNRPVDTVPATLLLNDAGVLQPVQLNLKMKIVE